MLLVWRGPDFGGAPDRGAGKDRSDGKLFGQTEAPMMISMMPPENHYNPDGSIATGRLSSAGRVGPLVQVGTIDCDGNPVPAGEPGEIVVPEPLSIQRYHKTPEPTPTPSLH